LNDDVHAFAARTKRRPLSGRSGMEKPSFYTTCKLRAARSPVGLDAGPPF